ncbi:MAG: DUF4214 domain-containing protein [Snowella sp.]
MKLFLLSITTIFSASLIDLTPVLAQSQRITCLRDRNIINCSEYGSFKYSSKNYKNRKPIRINCYRDRDVITCPNYGKFRYSSNNNNGDWSNNNANVQTEINNLYIQVLGRNADANGLSSYVQAVNRGRSLAEVRRSLANSQEFNQSINKVYQEFLGRNVDNNGLRNYRNIIINGRSFEDVRNEIANSPEAQNRNSNNRNYNPNGNYNPSNNNPNFEGEINNLYVQVLGRNANSNDFRNYNSQNWSFEQSRRNLANSQEFNQTINNLYREFLGRNADNNGLQSYRNQVLMAEVLRMSETKLPIVLKRGIAIITTTITITLINLIITLKMALEICFVNLQGFVFKKILTRPKKTIIIT